MAARILCVDDESDVLEAVRLHLLGMDIEVDLTTFDDPIKALAALDSEQEEYAMVLVDIMMPGMTGIEFMSKFKEISPRTVRVNMSSHADLDLVLEALGSNQIYDFIRKPLTREDFLASMKKGLEHYTLRIERDALAESLKEKNALLEDWNQRLDQEVKRKTLELDLRDRLMQHLSGCHHLSDPYQVVRDFVSAVLGDAQQWVYSKADESWKLKDSSESLSLSTPCASPQGAFGTRCGPMTSEELRSWESSLSMDANALAWGEFLQYREGVVGAWLIKVEDLDEQKSEALAGFSTLVGLLLYDEMTLDSIGELSEGLF